VPTPEKSHLEVSDPSDCLLVDRRDGFRQFDLTISLKMLRLITGSTFFALRQLHPAVKFMRLARMASERTRWWKTMKTFRRRTCFS
jgi:hypothetical protein